MKTILRSKGQELLDLATGTNGDYKYKETSSFSQEVTCISSDVYETFKDEFGESKYRYYNLRFKFTDKWKSIYSIGLIYIEGFSDDKWPGERATHNYVKINNLGKIVELLHQDGYSIDDRVFD